MDIYAGRGLRPEGSSDDDKQSAGLTRRIAGSPDLNPIENLWAIMKRRVEELRSDTKEELINVIITAWEGIEMSSVNTFVDSMPEQLEEVITNEGSHISF
jgi:hypothetical protein